MEREREKEEKNSTGSSVEGEVFRERRLMGMVFGSDGS